MTRLYLRSSGTSAPLTLREETKLRLKLLKVAMVLTALAASGLADFPLGMLGQPKCC